MAAGITNPSGKKCRILTYNLVRFDPIIKQILVDDWKPGVISDALILTKKIALGSNGTIVFQGLYKGRVVAVKRIIKGLLKDDSIETKSLIHSRDHVNFVSFYGREEDDNFIYHLLELCDCCLLDFVNNEKHQELWSNPTEFTYLVPFPSPALLELMKGIVAGLTHLHSAGFVYGNMKPSNVLMSGRYPKLSGVGVGTSDDNESFGWVAREVFDRWNACNLFSAGYGGWQSPKFVKAGSQTDAMDIFSLGCVLFFCLTKGQHPFGDSQRDYRVITGRIDNLYLVDHIPEAVDLFVLLLHRNPESRPRASNVQFHPFFWNPKERLSFMKDASEWLENQGNVLIFGELEEKKFLFEHSTHEYSVPEDFFKNLGFPSDCCNTIRSSIRVVQDIMKSYHASPTTIVELGYTFEVVEQYFRRMFPGLLMKVYKVIDLHFKQQRKGNLEDWFFSKYLKEINANVTCEEQSFIPWGPSTIM